MSNKEKLYRIKWAFKSAPDEWYIGPVLYLTGRNGSPRKLRPYTLSETEQTVRIFNFKYKRNGAKHSIMEVNDEYPRAD